MVDERDIEALEGLTKADMSRFFARYISPSSSERAKVSVHLTTDPCPILSDHKSPVQTTMSGVLTVDAPSNEGCMYSRTNGISNIIDRLGWKSKLRRSVEPFQDTSSLVLPAFVDK
jgi:hypothetical protein